MNNENPNLEKIISAFNEMQTMEQLLDLLNLSKRLLFQKNVIPFSPRQLNYHTISKYKTGQYFLREIPKKSGGKRTLHMPSKGLKQLQASLNLILQSMYQPHSAANGFVPGRSIVDNAKKHVGKGYVFNLDLKDFFPSIDQSRVWACLLLPPFNLGNSPERKNLANRLAILCCAPFEIISEDKTKLYKNVLPRGLQHRLY